jgi:hypothetical protein
LVIFDFPSTINSLAINLLSKVWSLEFGASLAPNAFGAGAWSLRVWSFDPFRNSQHALLHDDFKKLKCAFMRRYAPLSADKRR